MVEDEDVLNVFDDVLVPDEREDVLKNYINSNLNPETQKKTKREVGAFEKWLKTQNEPRPIESVEPEALNLLLGLYIISVKRQDGGLYEPSSLTSIFSSVKRYLEQKDYHENIMTSEKFKQARDSLATRKKELKAQGMGNQPNKVSTVGEKKNCLSRFLEGLEKKKKTPSLPFTIFRRFGGQKKKKKRPVCLSRFLEALEKKKKTPSLPFTIFRRFGGQKKKKKTPCLPFTILRRFGEKKKKKKKRPVCLSRFLEAFFNFFFSGKRTEPSRRGPTMAIRGIWGP